MDRHFFKRDKSWFSFFCSSVEDEELDALDDPDLLKELLLDELEEGEEEGSRSVLGFPDKGSFY